MTATKTRREQVIQDADGIARRVLVNLAESPVSWLHARGHIDDRQRAAGEALRADWERADMGPRVTMAWDAAAVTSRTARSPRAPEPGLAALSARDRLNAALDAAGPGLKDILWRVACAGEGIAAAESALGWPTRAGKLVLGFALTRVADYYRLR